MRRFGTSHLFAAASAAVALLATGSQISGQESRTAKGMFINLEGAEVGTAELTQTLAGVLIQVEVSGLEPGEHGFHVHETGSCDSADQFESAGGHLAMQGQQHGFDVESGPHAGDLPNQHVGEDGVLRADVLATGIALDGERSVFDDDGAAIVVHARADDYSSQPSGDAGNRVACAVIEAG